MHSVMTCHDVSCYQSNPDHLWTTKDDAFRDVISACERCGESNEAPKFLFLRFFCFFHLRLHQSQVCCLLFVDLFLYVFDHFYFLRLFVVFVFLVQTFRWFRPLRLFSLRQSFSAAPENGTYAAAIRACDVAEKIIAHVLIVIQFFTVGHEKT